MIKTIVKLAIVAVIANAAWHAFVPYSAHFKFKDAVEAASQYGSEKPDDELRAKVLEIAAEHDVPLTPEGFTLRRDLKHTIIDGSYVQPIEIFPGFSYPYTFTWHTDTFALQPPKVDDLLAPK
ncbi:MAG: hypothetical protein LAO77_02370 [Acidobacteriia bacterium]|nr:hypothetical protein [Terriglobia bacterium]